MIELIEILVNKGVEVFGWCLLGMSIVGMIGGLVGMGVCVIWMGVRAFRSFRKEW